MPSDFAGFDVLIDNDDGSTTPVAGQTIKVYDVDNLDELADLASDGNGHVAGAELAVDAGTLIRFSFSRTDGICGYTEKLTT